jgi:hypothetical protein
VPVRENTTIRTYRTNETAHGNHFIGIDAKRWRRDQVSERSKLASLTGMT